jgi:hypothetical protein
MILEEETFEAFGYYPRDLKPQSNKPILAACELCGEFKVTSKSDYRAFCNSCSLIWGEAKKGETHTEETKALMCKNHADFSEKKNPNYGKPAWNRGKTTSEETKVLMRKNHVDNKGDKHPSYKGGEKKSYKRYRKTVKGKIVNARAQAKHRSLGHIALNTYFEGSEWHHIMHNYVICIPKWLHHSMYHNLNTEKNMREVNVLALDFLVNGF